MQKQDDARQHVIGIARIFLGAKNVHLLHWRKHSRDILQIENIRSMGT